MIRRVEPKMVPPIYRGRCCGCPAVWECDAREIVSRFVDAGGVERLCIRCPNGHEPPNSVVLEPVADE